jgi:hypothetical protein
MNPKYLVHLLNLKNQLYLKLLMYYLHRLNLLYQKYQMNH